MKSRSHFCINCKKSDQCATLNRWFKTSKYWIEALIGPIKAKDWFKSWFLCENFEGE